MSESKNEKWAAVIAGVFTGIGVLALACGLGLLIAFPVKWTWNYTMPYMFGLKTITWGHAWCLYFLAKCLIRSSQTNTNK